jgi:RNA polymerase primary sigma factor
MRQLKIIKQLTSREEESLDRYLHEIGKIELISAEEEVHLAHRIHSGDLIARDRLVNANLRFVVSVSKQYQNRGMSLTDMINEGNLGLIKAAERFDETRGFKFISYAVWWIRQSIMQALAEQARIVRLPLNRAAHITKITRAVAVLEQKYEREPTPHEITQELELSAFDVGEAIKNSLRYVSFDAPYGQDNEGSLYDVMFSNESFGPDQELFTDSLKLEIERVLDTLTRREAHIIRLSFGLGGRQVHTLEETAVQYNLSRERVRQIKESAIRKIRHVSRSRVLKTYLGD